MCVLGNKEDFEKKNAMLDSKRQISSIFSHKFKTSAS